VKRHDYLPFGEELFAPVGGRSAAQGYAGGDGVRQQFTQKERDVETGLDYFGARYYSSVQGRFTSVDIAGSNLSNPQSLNKYAYTLNNPLRFIDPQGLYERDVHFQLTDALAMAAGFTAGDAPNIAQGDQSVDDDNFRGPATYEGRKNFHFTTQERRDQLWDSFVSAAGAYTGPKNSNENALDSLGTFLHAQQDSYSHDKYGSTLGQGWPPPTGPNPDKTFNDPEKADRMAEDSYNRLTTAATVLYNNQKISFNYKPLAWKVIKPLVQAFNRARTPEEKQQALNQIKALAQENLKRQAQEAIRKRQEEERKKQRK
jgi:RHS repeat-associated protein